MKRSSLGVSATSYLSIWERIDTLQFLERCHAFGAAGIQAPINSDPALIRSRAEEFGMYFEAMVKLPEEGDTGRFEKSLQDAKVAGAVCMRAACLGTRRYEAFKNLVDWQAHVERSHRSLELALPLIDKYKIALGLENHKDWTCDELVEIVRQYSSEYFGVCLDFGNNISILDDPMETIEKLAPYTVSTHVKDVATDNYKEGIRMSEVLLGSGHIDLRQALNAIRRCHPETRMTLEMITRDPLKIPMLTDAYWVTFPDKSAQDLARTLRFVNEHLSGEPLPLAADASEDENVMGCLERWSDYGAPMGSAGSS